jgi:hypothetical protein
MADASLYLFDGFNLLHAGPFTQPRELVDALASFVATEGARGVVVFDGVGEDAERGPLSVRYAPNADTLLERLAAEHRGRERVVLVSSDIAVLETAGREISKCDAISPAVSSPSRTSIRIRLRRGSASALSAASMATV